MRTKKDFIRDANTFIARAKLHKEINNKARKAGVEVYTGIGIHAEIEQYCDDAVIENIRFDREVFHKHIMDGLSND